jgi:hypothetical protein
MSTASSRAPSQATCRSSNQPSFVLKRAAASRPSGEWNDDDFDVLADGIVVGRIFNSAASPVGLPWMWTLIYGHHEGRTPTHGYEADRDAGRDNDRAYGQAFQRRIRAMGIRDRPISPRSPWQNPIR